MNDYGTERLRILLFEDNLLVRSALRNALSKQGWEVLSYPDPDFCPLRQWPSCRCREAEVCADVLVTDFEMPHIDGLEFARELLEKGCRIQHLAMLSETEDQNALTRARDLGFRLFSKSEGVPALLQWLHEIDGQLARGRQLTPWVGTSN
jgi:CheY-like chemotaxis protein